jgi:hypothetical protein
LKEDRSTLKTMSDLQSKLSRNVVTQKTLQKRRVRRKKLEAFKRFGHPRIITTRQIIQSAIIIKIIEKATQEVNVVVIKIMVGDYEAVSTQVEDMIFQFTDLMGVVTTTDKMMAIG